MKVNGKFAEKIETTDFIVTAEFQPRPSANGSATQAALKAIGDKPAAINVSDNHHGIAMSSIAVCAEIIKNDKEPVCQIVTRDRNRIALQSDLLGAASLGIKNVLCLSGYHQETIGCTEANNSYDIDSTQLIEIVKTMSEKGRLSDGTKIDGQFSMLIGAVANPFLKPLELNILRLANKVQAGAKFIQTHPVFDFETFSQWLQAVSKEGIANKAAILAGVQPLDSADEAESLRNTYSDYNIPDEIIARLKKAGDKNSQKKEGLNICVEIINKLKKMDVLRGIHIISGGKEEIVPQIVSAAGL